MRGKVQPERDVQDAARITPAYAGKRHHPEPGQSSSEDHPRVCGEKCWILSSNTPLMGSPPRMRGKAFGLVLYKVEIGITSACAGKSVRTCAVQSRDRDHPRMCGEKHGIAILTTCTLGSPPPVRGKDNRQGDQLADPWITPACAGKSTRNETCWHRPWDHPCVCGEKIEMPYELLLKEGSPPRMRGKARSRCFVVEVMRITPAYAGKSSIQHLTASLGEFEVQKGHPVPHLRQRLQVWPDHARHFRHGLILHASRSAGQGRRLCRAPCPDTAGSGTPRGPSPAKRPHRSPPAATPGGCRAWQSGATAPGSR